jgi:hypothetical protein
MMFGKFLPEYFIFLLIPEEMTGAKQPLKIKEALSV